MPNSSWKTAPYFFSSDAGWVGTFCTVAIPRDFQSTQMCHYKKDPRLLLCQLNSLSLTLHPSGGERDIRWGGGGGAGIRGCKAANYPREASACNGQILVGLKAPPPVPPPLLHPHILEATLVFADHLNDFINNKCECFIFRGRGVVNGYNLN